MMSVCIARLLYPGSQLCGGAERRAWYTCIVHFTGMTPSSFSALSIAESLSRLKLCLFVGGPCTEEEQLQLMSAS